jgi:hypothetical protein
MLISLRCRIGCLLKLVKERMHTCRIHLGGTGCKFLAVCSEANSDAEILPYSDIAAPIVASNVCTTCHMPSSRCNAHHSLLQSAGGNLELREVLLQCVLGTRIETKRLDNSLKGSLVIQSVHNPAVRNPDVRALNATLGDFTAQLSSSNAIIEAVLSVQVRCCAHAKC